MYDKGKGVPQNDLEAAKWYRLAAEQGDAAAQYTLGLLRLLECNRAQREWLEQKKQALRQRRVLPDWRIGQCDLVEAYAWVLLAAAQGHQGAGGGKELFTKEMTSEQVADAQKLAGKLWERIEASTSQ